MAVEKRFNLVTFQPDGVSSRLHLTLQGEWVITGGLVANCNVAVVPDTELSKLPGPPIDVRGTIEFWYSADAGDPDVAMQGWYLVDVAPDVIGRGPGDSTDRVKVFRLTFADHRHGFVEPRGARLSLGEVNPSPAPIAFELESTRDLILTCLEAMNYPGAPPLDPAIIPATVDDVRPPSALDWSGAHAPTELAGLLKHCGHVYVPRFDGTGSIVRPNFGNLPALPSDRLSSVVPISSVDRRPRKVIITSAPVAKVKTYGSATPAPPAWRFVAQDHTDNMAWKPIGEIAALGGGFVAALTAFRDGLPNVPPEWRDHYWRQMFKALRLDPAAFPPRKCAILRKVFYPSSQYSGRTEDPYVKLLLAIRRSDGAWVNEQAAVKASSIIPHEGVIVFEDRLGSVREVLNSERPIAGEQHPELAYQFTPATTIDTEPNDQTHWIRPTFSVETWDGQGKVFAAFGFERDELDLVPLDEPGTDAVAQEHLLKYRPDTAIYSCPELRQITSFDTAEPPKENRPELLEAAGAYAAKLAVEIADAEAQIAVVKGFFPVELSGRVSEVRFSQDGCATTFVVNGWHVPGGPSAGDFLALGESSDAMASSPVPNKQPGRSARGARAALATTLPSTGDGAMLMPPAAFVVPERAEPTGFRPILIEVGEPLPGQTGRYEARSLSGRVNSSATGNLAMTDLGKKSALPDCELWFSGDIGGTAPGGLKAGDVIHGLASIVINTARGRRLIVLSTGPRMKKKTVVVNVGCVSGALVITKEDVWVFDV